MKHLDSERRNLDETPRLGSISLMKRLDTHVVNLK